MTRQSQLQALHASHQQRAKHAPGIAVPSPVNPGPAAASPASVAAPSPAGGSVSAPSPAATIPTPLSTSQLLPADAASAPSPGIMSALAQAVRQPATPTTPGPAGPAGPAGVRPPGGMPPGGGQIRQPMLQKQQLLNSIVAFYRQTNQPLPTEVFNGERDGAFKLGGNWVELTEMFVMVFRLGGMTKVSSDASRSVDVLANLDISCCKETSPTMPSGRPFSPAKTFQSTCLRLSHCPASQARTRARRHR